MSSEEKEEKKKKKRKKRRRRRKEKEEKTVVKRSLEGVRSVDLFRPAIGTVSGVLVWQFSALKVDEKKSIKG